MTAPIGIFTRAPIPGHTKTRLIPALGPEGAAELHRAFLRDVVSRVASIAPITLFVTGPTDDPAFDGLGLEELSEDGTLSRVAQVGEDLGERMAHAFHYLRHHCSDGSGAAYLLGSDAPTFPEHLLRRVVEANHERVLTPTADGGYALIGGRAPWRFEGVRWSAPTTLAETLALNPGASLTEPWYDVDDPDDLELLRLHLKLDPAAAPCTASALAEARQPETRVVA